MLGCLLLPAAPWSLALLKAYSVAILAFLAGNWWSTTLLQRAISTGELRWVLVLSNLVVIAAVLTLIFTTTLTLVILVFLFLLLLAGERWLPGLGQQPVYYRRMRTNVTGWVVVLLISAYLLTP